jgi:hypothetical protein
MKDIVHSWCFSVFAVTGCDFVLLEVKGVVYAR